MEPKKDRLEEYFRKSLESLGDQPSPSGWDMPSDKVWEGIEAGMVSNKPGKRPLFPNGWLVVLVVVLLGVVAWQWWAYQRQMESLSDEVQKHTALIEKLQNGIAEEKQEATVSTNTQQNNKEAFSKNESIENNEAQKASVSDGIKNDRPLATNQPPKPDQGIKSKSGGSTPGLSAHEAATNGSSDGNNPAGNPGKETSVARRNESPQNENVAAQNRDGAPGQSIAQVEGPIVSPEKMAPFDALAQKPGFPSRLAAKQTLLMAPSPQLLTLVTPSTPGSLPASPVGDWVLGAHFSPTYSYRSISHKVRDVSTPYEKTESPKLSYTAGLSVGYGLSEHWRLNSGVSYQRFNQSSRHTVGFRYNTVGANREPGGDLVNSYTANLETSYGDAAIEVRVANDARSTAPAISEGRIFPIRFTAGLELQHLGVPLLLEYHFGNERFAVSLKGGLVGSFLLDKGMDITDVRTLHDRLIARNTFIIKNRFLQNINDFTLDLQLSAGAQIGLSKNLALTLEPTFRKNLTPVFENEKLETRLFSLAANAGLMYRF